MIAYKMYENNIIFSLSENVMHHFRKSKILLIYFIENLHFPVSKQYMYSKFLCCHIPSISNLFPNIEQRLLFKMVSTMNEFVNRLLKNWTMLCSFQMPLVFSDFEGSK